ncbi:hypothetical protein JCM3775_002643 [Rhodotorula graminis]|uniref:EXPERA domain-containing protein n=1 Tax=Rhodotorula graminis (strain WP1) TaxID=578459 RepID=A0A0P9F087_RHOGW|nr:uncharacterized protein RHOBADRAFT_46480 [Rhodotorula graminis WP1]KPV72892.1 hypothetical protein RHOBADRAFT_46480 [Rhodotorula graminis WP1]
MAPHAPPPSLLTPTTVYSLLSTLAILVAALALARLALPTNRCRSPVHRYTFVWLAFDALIHFILEGSFIYQSFPRPRTVNSSKGPFALLWQEYALADTRWGTSDPTVVAIELITVLGAGPLAVYCAAKMCGTSEAWRFWIVILSVAELYGGWMTFAPEWISGSPSLNTSHWLYTYVYLLFFNGLWVIIPLALIADSGREICAALGRDAAAGRAGAASRAGALEAKARAKAA